MIGLGPLLVIIGLILWLLTVYNTLGIILLVIGIVLIFVAYPAGWYGGRGAP